MSRLTLTGAQAQRALTLCEKIRSHPGMWIAHFDWHTADAFWSGYLHALHDDAVADFRTWGLAQLGAPESNTDPISHLRKVHGGPADEALDPSFTRARATEVAGHVCDLIEAYVRARTG